MKIKEKKFISFLLLWFRKLRGNNLTFLTFLLSFLGAKEPSVLQKGRTSRWDSRGTKQWQKNGLQHRRPSMTFSSLIREFRCWNIKQDKPDSLSRNCSLDAHLFTSLQSLYIHSAKHQAVSPFWADMFSLHMLRKNTWYIPLTWRLWHTVQSQQKSRSPKANDRTIIFLISLSTVSMFLLETSKCDQLHPL